ncbi:MAG: DUF1611 domain-containing protein [Vulcanimicrobiaceae bacterium]
MRRYLIYAPDRFARRDAKTAHGVIAYSSDQVVAIVDPACAGKRVCDVLPLPACRAPIVGSLREGLAYKPTTLLLGTAPVGGALPDAWRGDICAAIEAGLEIASGLHQFLTDDPQFAKLAREYGVRLWDVRATPPPRIFDGSVYAVPAPTLLCIGNDCAVGKMTVALELCRAAERHSVCATFVPTGQTGILIAGWGTAIDRVIADFVPGAVEALVLEAAKTQPALIVVEGQGAINHPAYAPVSLALLYGSAPDALLLVCDPLRTAMHSFDTPTLTYRESIRLNEALCAAVKPACVVGVALNTRGLCDADAQAQIAEAHRQTGLPADDVVRYGPDALYEAIASSLQRLPRLVPPVTSA